jgi:hypothetical protein
VQEQGGSGVGFSVSVELVPVLCPPELLPLPMVKGYCVPFITIYAVPDTILNSNLSVSEY